MQARVNGDQVDAYPACRRYCAHSCGVKAVRADAMAVERLSAHLAAALRNEEDQETIRGIVSPTNALILANTISIGVKGVLELIPRINSALNGRSPG